MSMRGEASDALTRIYRQADPRHPRIHLPESAPREAECFIPEGMPYTVIVVGSLRNKWNGAHRRAIIYGAPFEQRAQRRQGCIGMRDGLSAPAWVETIVCCAKIIAATQPGCHVRSCPFCGKPYKYARMMGHHLFRPDMGCATRYEIDFGCIEDAPLRRDVTSRKASL